jgi:hypothetical protein
MLFAAPKVADAARCQEGEGAMDGRPVSSASDTALGDSRALARLVQSYEGDTDATRHCHRNRSDFVLADV